MKKIICASIFLITLCFNLHAQDNAVLNDIWEILNECNPSAEMTFTRIMNEALTSETKLDQVGGLDVFAEGTNKRECAGLVKDYLSENEIPVDKKLSESGGTLLHWVVDKSIELGTVNSGKFNANQALEAIFLLGIDPKIEDENGLTAEKYWKSNKKEMKYYYNEGQNLKNWFKEY